MNKARHTPTQKARQQSPKRGDVLIWIFPIKTLISHAFSENNK
jgi:hypothetical protein